MKLSDPLVSLPALDTSATVLHEQTSGRQRRIIVRDLGDEHLQQLRESYGVFEVTSRPATTGRTIRSLHTWLRCSDWCNRKRISKFDREGDSTMMSSRIVQRLIWKSCPPSRATGGFANGSDQSVGRSHCQTIRAIELA